MIETILKYNFLQNAIMAAVLPASPVHAIGVYIMETGDDERRIAHTAFGGIDGVSSKLKSIFTALGVSVIAALRRHSNARR